MKPLFEEPRRDYSEELAFARRLIARDLDGDGLEDLAAILYRKPPRWLLSDGQGGYREQLRLRHAAPLEIVQDVAVGDVDGDGLPDLVVGTGDLYSPVIAPNRLYLSQGPRSLLDASDRLPPGDDNAQSVVLGDVDGDGDLDLFVGTGRGPVPHNQGTVNRLHLNDGTGGFHEAASRLPATTDDVTCAFLEDLDRDGDLDLHLSLANGLGRILLNDGTGRFLGNPRTGVPGKSLALGDVDGDGDVDALSTTANGRLFLNDGNAGFSDAGPAFPALSSEHLCAILTDLDRDGDLDAFLGSDENGWDAVLLNDGSGSFLDETWRLLPGHRGTRLAAALDRDQDGDPEIVSVSFARGTWVGTRGRVRTSWNDGAGRLEQASPVFPFELQAQIRCFTLGDLDGDLLPDLVIGTDDVFGVSLADGHGGFLDLLPLPIDPTTGPLTPRLGDLDGDGDLDLYVGRAGAQSLDRFFLNDGTGTLTDRSQSLPPIEAETLDVALADVDGDGDLDVYAANGGYGAAAHDGLYLNDGTGTFRDASRRLPWQEDRSSRVEMVDVDADGDVDALVLGSGLDLFTNDGTGRFASDPARLGWLAPNVRTFLVGDVDGSGSPDLVVGTRDPYGTSTQFLSNDGTGVFQHAARWTVDRPLLQMSLLALADVDQDGDPDLLGASRDAALFLNDGRGTFQREGSRLWVPLLKRPLFVDGDLDGDLDMWMVGITGMRLGKNVTRQLASTAPARIGKALALELDGPSLGGWILIAGSREAWIPMAERGVLRVDPSSVVLRRAGSFDLEGRSEIVLQLPNDPNLVGLSWHWQAYVRPPMKLTNLETTPFHAW